MKLKDRIEFNKHKEVVLMRDGLYVYAAGEIGAPNYPADMMLLVYRPKEEVKKAHDRFAELKRLPIINTGHPDDFVNLDSDSSYAHGYVDSPEYKEEGPRALLKGKPFLSPESEKKFKDGIVEVSCGWEGDFEEAPKGKEYDFIQRFRDINHVAMVESGRCGYVCSIKDGVAMKKVKDAEYKVMFTGRKKGQNVEPYQIIETVPADNEEHAIKRLGEFYEKITLARAVKISDVKDKMWKVTVKVKPSEVNTEMDKKEYSGEFDGETEAEARKDAKEWYASEFGMLPEHINIVRISKMSDASGFPTFKVVGTDDGQNMVTERITCNSEKEAEEIYLGMHKGFDVYKVTKISDEAPKPDKIVKLEKEVYQEKEESGTLEVGEYYENDAGGWTVYTSIGEQSFSSEDELREWVGQKNSFEDKGQSVRINMKDGGTQMEKVKKLMASLGIKDMSVEDFMKKFKTVGVKDADFETEEEKAEREKKEKEQKDADEAAAALANEQDPLAGEKAKLVEFLMSACEKLGQQIEAGKAEEIASAFLQTKDSEKTEEEKEKEKTETKDAASRLSKAVNDAAIKARAEGIAFAKKHFTDVAPFIGAFKFEDIKDKCALDIKAMFVKKVLGTDANTKEVAVLDGLFNAAKSAYANPNWSKITDTHVTDREKLENEIDNIDFSKVNDKPVKEEE